MKLITKRLTVMSLTPRQMMMCAGNVHDLEKDLTLTYHADPLDTKFRDTAKKQAHLCEDDDDNHLWHTFWMFNLDRELIGGAYFGGLPDQEGKIVLTFWVDRDFTGRGYAAEAVNKLVEWAFRQENVKYVVSGSAKDDPALHRVLEKCGFEKYRAEEHSFWWMMSASMLEKKKAADAKQNIFTRKTL